MMYLKSKEGKIGIFRSPRNVMGQTLFHLDIQKASPGKKSICESSYEIGS